MPESRPRGTVIILNPNSGSGNHSQAVRSRAELHGAIVEQTVGAGDAIALAQRAAEAGISMIVAAGGDGTVNEVVQGIDRAGAINDVTLGILPLGTGNNFAKNLGITDLDSAFAALTEGERRWIDVGQANGRLFLNSCVAGLRAESSSETSPEMKNRLGVLAYVITTLRSISNFEALRLSVTIDDSGTETDVWRGEAICVLVGNGRRFAIGGSNQANMEDGLLDVTIIEDVSALDLMSEALVEQLLGQDSDHIVRRLIPTLNITIADPESTRFSLDGEIILQRSLTVSVRSRALRLAVGEAYSPDPEPTP